MTECHRLWLSFPLFCVSLFAMTLWGQSTESHPDAFDAQCWKVTLPLMGKKATALELLNPQFAEHLENESLPADVRQFFSRTSEGLSFHVRYTGVTTSDDTDYSRTELREMQGGEERNWKLSEGGKLDCRLKITGLTGGANKLIFMQIHGYEPESKPLLKCIWEKGSIKILTKSGTKLQDLRRQPKYADISSDQWFDCSIHAQRQSLRIAIDGETVETFGPGVLDDWPPENSYYFKAGNYLQHADPAAAATVVFSSIKVSH